MATTGASAATPHETPEHSAIADGTVPVSADAPFPDGYDIAAGREAQLQKMKPTRKPRQPAQKIVPAPVAPGVAELGRLVDDEPDTMTLHTREAYGVFTGRRPDAQGKSEHIGGGARFAAVLKSIWDLSGNDNPYADWLLITMHGRLTGLRLKIERATSAKQKLIDLVKTQGLSFSVMRSRSPKTVELGFRSPYGYATVALIVVFDYYVRLVKTLIRKDRLSDAQGRAAIREAGRGVRALFLEPIRWERFLLRREMRALCRADFLPSADDAGKKRAAVAVTLFGEVPRTIFTGAQVPRHTRRRARFTPSELQLLEQASLHADNTAHVDETELL